MFEVNAKLPSRMRKHSRVIMFCVSNIDDAKPCAYAGAIILGLTRISDPARTKAGAAAAASIALKNPRLCIMLPSP